MVISAWIVAVTLLLGPPAPTLEDPIEGPVEGPTRPSEVESTSEPGIEFATEPPATEPESDPETDPNEATAVAAEPSWPTPGNAPPDGFGFITAGAILLPTTALGSWALYGEARYPVDRVGIIVGAAGFGAIGVALIGTGLHRHAKLKRWTLAYRVVAPPQGAGLITAGGLAAAFGGTVMTVGIYGLARGYGLYGGLITGAGAVGLAVAAPLSLYFGKLRRQQYLDTGGWYRPPLPTVQLAPRLIVTDTTFGLGVAGRF